MIMKRLAFALISFTVKMMKRERIIENLLEKEII
jgi:hypothetical protein